MVGADMFVMMQVLILSSKMRIDIIDNIVRSQLTPIDMVGAHVCHDATSKMRIDIINFIVRS